MTTVDFVPEIQILQFIMCIDSGTEIIQISQYKSRKIYDKTQNIFLLKGMKKLEIQRTCFSIVKKTYEKSIVNIILSG